MLHADGFEIRHRIRYCKHPLAEFPHRSLRKGAECKTEHPARYATAVVDRPRSAVHGQRTRDRQIRTAQHPSMSHSNPKRPCHDAYLPVFFQTIHVRKLHVAVVIHHHQVKTATDIAAIERRTCRPSGKHDHQPPGSGLYHFISHGAANPTVRRYHPRSWPRSDLCADAPCRPVRSESLSAAPSVHGAGVRPTMPRPDPNYRSQHTGYGSPGA